MLSRLAQAPRLGLTAARLSRPVAAPVLRFRPVPVATTAIANPWAQSFASKSGKNRNNKSKKSDESSETPAKASQETSDVAKETDEQIPFDKLPDLTQGIPSTLDFELDQKAGKEKTAESAADSALAEVAEEEGGRGGGRERPEYVSTSDRNRKKWTRVMLVGSAVGGLLSLVYMGRAWDPIEASRYPDIPSDLAHTWARAKKRLTDSVNYYQEPAFEKLLSDVDPSFARPYTLCLSLDDLLVHSEWSREHGWRVAKRPGFDYFIRYLSQYYELVLFTTVPYGMGEPVVRKLDPFRLIMWPLFREATKYEDGEIVKDLSYLNRDLSKVIIMDTNPKHVRNQPENAIIMEPWKGDPNDKELVAMIPFLEYIHTMQYSDVRKVIKSFEGKNIPKEFARREAIARKEFNARVEAEKAKHKHGSGVGALGSLLGLKPSNMSMMVSPDGEPNPSEAFAQGKMLQDIARERGQRAYEMLDKEIRENGEKWLKEEAQLMEKAQQEAMNNMMGSFSGMFGNGQQNSPEQKK